MLAETVLERVEPALRSAAEDRPEWSSCSWCPVCATAALLRGEHHDVLTAIADHGTAIVTVLREALAGAPVEPVLPTDDPTGPHTHRGSHVRTGEPPATGDAASATTRATSDPGPVQASDTAGSAGATVDPGDSPADTATDAGSRDAGRPEDRTGGIGDPTRSSRRSASPRKRSGYTDIPVTIRI